MADKNVILVEGRDDEHVVYALLNHHEIPRILRVKEKEGISNLLGTLEVELLGSELEHLGIIVDADTDIAGRWQRISQVLANAGYSQIPNSPDKDGTIIIQADKPSVGIWIMPDNSLPGMLEHFIEFLVPPGDRLWPRVVNCVEAIPQEERLFSGQHLIKAQIHTWLAWQEEPGPQIGLAITKRYLDVESDHANAVIAWIRRLFNL